jgi:hypothetical protein
VDGQVRGPEACERATAFGVRQASGAFDKDYRTRRDRSLKTVSDAGHVHEQPGKHTICVKVVDVFGGDASMTLEVEA